MRDKIFIGLVTILMIVMARHSHNLVQKEKARADRQTENIRIMGETIEAYETFSGRQAAEIEVLTFKRSELESLHKATIDSLKVYKKKLSDVKNVTTITTTVVDTVYVPATYKDTIKCFDFSDNFLSLHGEDLADKYKITYSYKGQYDIVRVEERKRFWGFLWKTKKIKTKSITVIPLNPKEKVESILSIDLE